ncbi:SIR2 family protein, partial [Salmonella enterica subsp. enterica serovar Kentucky]|nr:SIR2 family protein [Salmonella enterica subsp. enterica serovar Kentucky]
MSTLRIGMEIQEFVSHYKNHPVLFIGTGFSLRYLENSFSWDGLLLSVAMELTGNAEFYYDLKAESLEG